MKQEKINFIPGLGEKPRDYKALSKHLKIIDVDWNTGKTKPELGKMNTLVSFSLGVLVACIHTKKSRVKRLILCSPTPMENLKEVKASEIIFMVGSKEKFCLENVQRVFKTLKCKKSIIVVPGADHRMTGNYRKKLLEVVEKTRD